MLQEVTAHTARPHVTEHSVQLLQALASVWLRYGFSAADVQEILRWSLVQTAMHDPRFAVPGRKAHRQTMARAAILTGLPRREVQRLYDMPRPDAAWLTGRQQRIDRLLQGWLQDREFTGADGKPLQLPMRSATGISFTDLVQRYCRDVPARAMADELLLRGNAEQLPERNLRFRDANAHRLHGNGDDVSALRMLSGIFQHALGAAASERGYSAAEGLRDGMNEGMQAILGQLFADIGSLLQRFDDKETAYRNMASENAEDGKSDQGVKDSAPGYLVFAVPAMMGSSSRPGLN